MTSLSVEAQFSSCYDAEMAGLRESPVPLVESVRCTLYREGHAMLFEVVANETRCFYIGSIKIGA